MRDVRLRYDGSDHLGGKFRALPESARRSFVNHNASAGNTLGIVGVHVIRRTQTVVVNEPIARLLIPDLDAESIQTSTAINLSIRGGQQEAVISCAINGSG